MIDFDRFTLKIDGLHWVQIISYMKLLDAIDAKLDLGFWLSLVFEMSDK